MGSAVSCFTNGDLEAYVDEDDMILFTAMHLTHSDIRHLIQHFRRVDMDAGGSIDVVELLTVIDVERTKFTERIFQIFDQDHSGRISIREFIMSLWNYCTVGDASLDLFAFDLYDRDGSGILSCDEIKQLLYDIYGGKEKVSSNQHAQYIRRELATVEKSHLFNIEAFQRFARRHPNLLFPAFNLQTRLRSHIMGQGFWDRASERRIELSKGTYLTMAELMRLHLNEELYNRLIGGDGWHKITPVRREARTVLKATGTLHDRAITDSDHVASSFHEAIVKPPPDAPVAPAARIVVGGKGVDYYMARPSSAAVTDRSHSPEPGTGRAQAPDRPKSAPRPSSVAGTREALSGTNGHSSTPPRPNSAPRLQLGGENAMSTVVRIHRGVNAAQRGKKENDAPHSYHGPSGSHRHGDKENSARKRKYRSMDEMDHHECGAHVIGAGAVGIAAVDTNSDQHHDKEHGHWGILAAATNFMKSDDCESHFGEKSRLHVDHKQSKDEHDHHQQLQQHDKEKHAHGEHHHRKNHEHHEKQPHHHHQQQHQVDKGKHDHGEHHHPHHHHHQQHHDKEKHVHSEHQNHHEHHKSHQ